MKKTNKSNKETLDTYVVRIQNLTDEKLYDVKVFDFEHEKQNKIKYSTSMGSSYNQLLMVIDSIIKPKGKIVKLLNYASCDYEKFQGKQVECDIRLFKNSPNGEFMSERKTFTIDLYQQQPFRAVLNDIEFDFFRETNLVYEYLMPETKAVLTIYVRSEKKK